MTNPTLNISYISKSNQYAPLVNRNLHSLIPGGGAYSDPAFKVAEISPSRTEIYLRANTDYSGYAELQDITRD